MTSTKRKLFNLDCPVAAVTMQQSGSFYVLPTEQHANECLACQMIRNILVKRIDKSG